MFLGSLFYKFDDTALEPQHIFNTIGAWMSGTINATLGELFAEYGAILIGGAELLTSLVLLFLTKVLILILGFFRFNKYSEPIDEVMSFINKQLYFLQTDIILSIGCSA